VMNWLRERLIWGAMLVSLAGALAACEEGPAEDAGEVIDEQGEEAVDWCTTAGRRRCEPGHKAPGRIRAGRRVAGRATPLGLDQPPDRDETPHLETNQLKYNEVLGSFGFADVFCALAAHRAMVGPGIAQADTQKLTDWNQQSLGFVRLSGERYARRRRQDVLAYQQRRGQIEPSLTFGQPWQGMIGRMVWWAFWKP
jgi:hypothetical protein